MKYAIVILCCEGYFDNSDKHRVLTGFESEDAAYDHALKMLIDAKHVKEKAGRYYMVHNPKCEGFVTSSEAVEEWSYDLELTEYFHVVEDHPVEIPLKVYRNEKGDQEEGDKKDCQKESEKESGKESSPQEAIPAMQVHRPSQ